MADWKPLLIQLISALLGSSIIVSALPNIIGAKHPDINILEPEIMPGISNGYSNFRNPDKNNFTNIDFTTYIINQGSASANNITIVLESPMVKMGNANNIANVSIEDLSGLKPFTPKKTDRGIVDGAIVNIHRLVAGGNIKISGTVVNASKFYSDFGTGIRSGPLVTISVASEEGIKEYPEKSLSLFAIPKFLSPQLLNIVLVFALIFSLITIIPKKIGQAIGTIKRTSFALNIKEEVQSIYNEIHDKLQNNLLSKSIFSTDTWYSKPYYERQKIFTNYDDFEKINKFYNQLEKRHSVFLEKYNGSTSDNSTITDENNNCLRLARNALSIDWVKYHGENILRAKPALTIIAIVLGSLFITYACEKVLPSYIAYVPEYVVYVFQNLIRQGDVLFYLSKIRDLMSISSIYIIQFILRSLAAFFIVKFLFNRSKPIFSTSYFPLSKANKLKIFAISAIVVGIPFILIVRAITSFFPNRDDDVLSFIFGNDLLITTAGFVSDIVRLTLLVWIIQKMIFKNHNIVRKLYYFTVVTGIAVGVLHILFPIMVGLADLPIVPQLFSLFNSGNIVVPPEYKFVSSLHPPSNLIAIILISIGIIQIIWSTFIARRRRRTLCYISLIATTLLTALGLFAIVLLNGIFDNLSGAGVNINYINLLDSLRSLLSDIRFMASYVALLLAEFAYIAMIVITICKERSQLKTSHREKETIVPAANKYWSVIIKKIINSNKIISSVTILLLISSIIVSSFFGGWILSSAISHIIEQP